MKANQAEEVFKLEAEARAKATRHVENMLQRPDQLEKIHQLTWRVSRKKASVEVLLNSAMQSQLEGVRTGFEQLDKVLEDIKDVKETMTDIDVAMTEVPDLLARLEETRAENRRHSQLTTARENLKNIFTVPETVEKTKNWIEDGNLLMAHQALVDLENSRDALLFELHRMGQKSVDDRELLADYFREVPELSLRLEKQLMFILLRAFATVRKNPKELVTALRIIEREEWSDEDCQNKQKRTGFLPPNRPKMWRRKCLEKLSESVAHKMEGSILESRDDNKMWLVRYLEIIRMIMLEDLRIAKHHLAPCFPPSYDIFAYCVALYHSVVSDRLQTIIEDGLEGQENVHMLEWVEKTYPGQTMMGSPALGLESILPVLDEHIVVHQLVASYLEQMKDNYSSWMTNTIKQEQEDWCSEKPPDIDADDFYHTASPVIIYQMVDENLQVANTISRELVHKVLVLGISQLGEFGGLYRQAVTQHKTKYFKDRGILMPGQFTAYMIAIINNCDRFEVLSQEMKSRWWKAGHHDVGGLAKFEQLLKTFQDVCQLSVTFLLEEVFEDIEREINFSDLVTVKWQADSQIVETVCITLGDYFEDYRRLTEKNLERVAMEAQLTVARKYITAMLQNTVMRPKIVLTAEEDRRAAATKIKSEANHCKAFFIEVAGDVADFDSPFDAIVTLADVLDCDEEMLFLELGTLCKKYPDVSHSQIVALLLLRGDLTKVEARQRAGEFSGGEEGGASRVLHARSVLGDVHVTAGLGNKLIPVAANLTDKLNKLKE